MIKTVEMYTVICDNCGADSCRDSEFVAWSDLDAAIDVANDSGWFETKEGSHHYCPDCYSFDYDDNLVIDQKRTKV